MPPKDRNPRDPDEFGVGMLDDGTLNVVSPDDLERRRAERDADEDMPDVDAFEDDEFEDLGDLEDLLGA